MTRLTFAAIVALVFTLSGRAQSTAPAQPASTYQNPVIAGDFADPSVIRVGDTYYAVGTSSEWGPAYPIYTSTDLVNWTYVGPVFAKLPAWTMGSYWAPELFYRNGLFYVYYTARRKADGRSYIGVATTTDIRRGFTDHGLIIEWTTEAIDAFVLEDAGKLYITWKAYGLDKGRSIEILGAELSPNGLKLAGPAFTLLTADRAGWEAGGVEGQAIVKRGRYFYMTYSGNACCGTKCNYQVGLARAERLQGPWAKYAGNPVLVGDDTWKCPGHGTLVTTPDGRYFYLHHAYHGQDFTFVGRQGVLSELVWNDQAGWPKFRYGTTTPAQAESPTGRVQQQNLDVAVDFARLPAIVPWVWDVSQPEPVYAVRDGELQLTPTATGSASSFLGLTVKRGTYTFSADVIPRADALQSICLYGDAKNALGVGVRAGALELWQLKDGTRTVLKTQSIADTAPVVTMQIRSRAGQFYEFHWQTGDNKPQLLTNAPLNGASLPRWDRAPRVGISVSGASGTRIRAVSMRYD